MAHLVPLARWLSRSGLVDALTAHYGLPGRLADYRRQFERTTRTVGEDPAIFATALETLAVKAFGDMGQTARLHLIRDRFIAGHSNCDLRRHLDSVSPETPIRDVVDRCRVWESHAFGKVMPTWPEVSNIEKLIQKLVRETQSRPPAVIGPPVPTTLEQILRSFLNGQCQRQRPPPRQRPTRRDWTDVVCFSCGKSGHTATRCPSLNEAFPFLQPDWRTEKTSGGFVMIPPRVTTDRRRAENGS